MNNTINKTKQCNDLLSFGSGNEISEENGHSNDPACKGLERNGNLLLKCSNCPATIRRSLNGKFLSINDISIIDVNKEIANTVLARYWKGIEADNSNCVIVCEYE